MFPLRFAFLFCLILSIHSALAGPNVKPRVRVVLPGIHRCALSVTMKAEFSDPLWALAFDREVGFKDLDSDSQEEWISRAEEIRYADYARHRDLNAVTTIAGLKELPAAKREEFMGKLAPFVPSQSYIDSLTEIAKQQSILSLLRFSFIRKLAAEVPLNRYWLEATPAEALASVRGATVEALDFIRDTYWGSYALWDPTAAKPQQATMSYWLDRAGTWTTQADFLAPHLYQGILENLDFFNFMKTIEGPMFDLFIDYCQNIQRLNGAVTGQQRRDKAVSKALDGYTSVVEGQRAVSLVD